MSDTIPVAVRTVLVALALVALPSCSGDDGDAAGSTSTSPTTEAMTTEGPDSSTEPSSTTSDPAPSSSAEEPRPQEGCTSGSAEVPGDAASRETVDLDGDGRPDTVWLSSTEDGTTVGVATAAGGGSQMPYESASPIPRSVLVADVDEKGPVEMIVSDGRGASLYAFIDCEIRPVLNAEGETYEFDLQDLRGNGTGIGCVDTDEGRRLVGLRATDRTNTEVSWSRTIIELDGSTATNGNSETGSYRLPEEQDRAELLDQITCGELTMDEDGLTESP